MAVKLKLYQNMCNYRREMSFGYVQTYPLPTPSMVKGMVHALLGLKSFHNLKIGIAGNYDTIACNMQRIIKLDKSAPSVVPAKSKLSNKSFLSDEPKYHIKKWDIPKGCDYYFDYVETKLDKKTGKEEEYFKLDIEKIKSEFYEPTENDLFSLKEGLTDKQMGVLYKTLYMVRDQRVDNPYRIKVKSSIKTGVNGLQYVDQIVDMYLTLHIQFEEPTLNDALFKTAQQKTITLGRHEDICRLDSIEMVNISQSDDSFTLKNDIYFNKETAAEGQHIGTHYRLPFYYLPFDSDKHQDKTKFRRQFKFVDVVHITAGRTIEEPFVDSDEEIVDLLSIEV